MPLLNEVLLQLENETIDRFEIYTSLLLINDPGHLFELEAEKAAFFVEYNYDLGTSSFSMGDFYFNELTGKEKLCEILLYWNKRRLDSKNPLMRFTYSILLWELKAHLHDKTILPVVVQDIAEAALQITSLINSGVIMHYIMFYLNYALVVASKAKQTEINNRLKDSIMSFCGRVDLLDKQGIWYPVYQYL